MEVIVKSAGHEARVWSDFITNAKVYEGPGFKWSVPALRFIDDTVLVSAVVVADTPENAIRRATTVVRNVGHRVDRYDKLDWSGLVATATFYRSGP